MKIQDSITIKAPRGHFFQGSFQHLLILGVLLVGTFNMIPIFDGPSFLGLSLLSWFALSVGLVVLQQFLGWFVFRSQLQWNLLHRIFGEADFVVWGLVFFPLLLARPLLLVFIGMTDSASLGLPLWLRLGGASVLFLLAAWAMYSVLRYFGIKRALGGDHFRESLRTLPLVKGGIYRYTHNAMYSIVFLALWAIALVMDSRAALLGAAFQHAYIWVHFYCTEEPDMRILHP